ncbi:MAG: VWA domain-containing protein [Acidobacteria bacterium]|nr:VWA domain-containing protein [Acidobacteriota bacterium]
MRYRYTRFTGDDLEGVDLESLLEQLSDLLLASGFDDPYTADSPADHSLQSLHEAILEALLNGGLLDDRAIERLLGDPADGDSRSQLEHLVDQLIERLAQEGYITLPPDLDRERARREAADGFPGGEAGRIRFEVTDKGLDFLGYRALRDLMGSLGKSSLGRHDTRDFSTGVEASAAPKPYEFGDTLNIDASSTILNAVERGGLDGAGGIDVQYADLMVAQGEYQSSCATVLLLDCSHSMILYGEDRFTPAKRVALALSNLIRHQYPGDSLHVVLFHDSAEEIPLGQLARARVGPYYTNTREGLRLARRVLERQRRDMRQIVMITDGKPSALTEPDGRIYRNAFGLDPRIVAETFAEVAACRKGGIMINTFMLARDYDLVAFVRKVTEICHGKAYFTTPQTLGRYVLFDYVNRKTRTVH